jgi:DNA uptake protein ComE-like DNA-binding protein
MLAFLSGCAKSEKPTPAEIREKAAEATSTLKNDAQALGQGVKQGWSKDNQLDLNTATRDQLTKLPTIAPQQADRIIAERPYTSPKELVSKRVISQSQYDKIAEMVTAK